MAENEKNLPPRIYHIKDPDQIFNLWKDMVGQVTDLERLASINFQNLVDPDTAPSDFIELMLRHLGNPFYNVNLTLIQKRKLAKFLVPIYRQKGTAAGIINTVRFLTGIELTIEDPHGDPVPGVGWEVGLSYVGVDTYAGGDSTKCNLLSWSENFDNPVWQLDGALVFPDSTPGPSPFGGLADEIGMHPSNYTDIAQYFNPLMIPGETFTGSVWLKASEPTVVALVLGDSISGSYDVEGKAITTSWQRFLIQHVSPPTPGPLEFHIANLYGVPGNLWAWGAQVVRGDHPEPYVKTTNDGADCSHPGPWIYHFIIRSPVALTAELESIVRMVADFIKPAHTHYTLFDANDPGAIDHWEVGLSEVGVQTFVHS